MNTPCVYLVGAGPGDPSLVSIRGRRFLQAADVIVHDHRVHAGLLRMAKPGAERIDVGAAAPKPLDQDAICFLIAEKAREGKTVARLKWGDPFVFDSGGKEALFLHEQRIPFEVVPGIPAAIGGLAYAGVPITYPGWRRRHRLHPRPRRRDGYAGWRRLACALARLHGTLVCYAGARQIASMTKALVAHGRSERRIGCADLQRHPSIAADGPGHTRDDRERNRERRRGAARRRRRSQGCGSIFDGSTTVRSSASASSSRDRASRRASSSRCWRIAARKRSWRPTIRILPPEDLDDARPRVRRRRHVRLDHLHERQRGRSLHGAAARDRRRPRSRRAFASARLERQPPRGSGGSAFASTSRRRSIAAKRWSRSSASWGRSTASGSFSLRADIGRELLGDELRDAGAEVLEVVAYRTVIGGAEREEAEIYRMLLDRQIDAITFTSASTVRNFASILGPDQAADLLRTTVVACIGPVTAEAAQQLDIATTVMPERVHDSRSGRRARRALRRSRSIPFRRTLRLIGHDQQ